MHLTTDDNARRNKTAVRDGIGQAEWRIIVQRAARLLCLTFATSRQAAVGQDQQTGRDQKKDNGLEWTSLPQPAEEVHHPPFARTYGFCHRQTTFSGADFRGPLSITSRTCCGRWCGFDTTPSQHTPNHGTTTRQHWAAGMERVTRKATKSHSNVLPLVRTLQLRGPTAHFHKPHGWSVGQ